MLKITFIRINVPRFEPIRMPFDQIVIDMEEVEKVRLEYEDLFTEQPLDKEDISGIAEVAFDVSPLSACHDN